MSTQSQTQPSFKLFSFSQTKEGAAELTDIAAKQRSRGRIVTHQGVIDGKLCIKVELPKPRKIA